jgi:hypothetical protein
VLLKRSTLLGRPAVGPKASRPDGRLTAQQAFGLLSGWTVGRTRPRRAVFEVGFSRKRLVKFVYSTLAHT